MLKRDIAGLVRIYSVAGIFGAFWIYSSVKVIFSIVRFWAKGNLAYNLFDSIVLFCLFLATLLTLFFLIRSQKAWVRQENARNQAGQFPYYNLPLLANQSLSPERWQQDELDILSSDNELSSSRRMDEDNGQVLALKMRFSNGSIRKIVLAYIGVLLVLLLIVEGIVLVAFLSSGQNERVAGEILIILAGFVVYAILTSPLICFIILLEYQRIEIGAHVFLRQQGLIRQRIFWDEIRLFAVGGKIGRGVEWIELSGTRTLLRWPFIPKSRDLGGGSEYTYLMRETLDQPYQEIKRSEYLYQVQRIYRYIQQRTDQPLRDLRQ